MEEEILKILKEDFGITTGRQFYEAYSKLRSLDITVFCERYERGVPHGKNQKRKTRITAAQKINSAESA